VSAAIAAEAHEEALEHAESEMEQKEDDVEDDGAEATSSGAGGGQRSSHAGGSGSGSGGGGGGGTARKKGGQRSIPTGGGGTPEEKKQRAATERAAVAEVKRRDKQRRDAEKERARVERAEKKAREKEEARRVVEQERLYSASYKAERAAAGGVKFRTTVAKSLVSARVGSVFGVPDVAGPGGGAGGGIAVSVVNLAAQAEATRKMVFDGDGRQGGDTPYAISVELRRTFGTLEKALRFFAAKPDDALAVLAQVLNMQLAKTEVFFSFFFSSSLPVCTHSRLPLRTPVAHRPWGRFARCPPPRRAASLARCPPDSRSRARSLTSSFFFFRHWCPVIDWPTRSGEAA
jgi:hypothetical protein